MSSPHTKCIFLWDDDLLEIFEFISRPVLGKSTSLVNWHFNELAQSKMHVCRKHFAEKMTVFGRQMQENEWRECCLALGDMFKYEPFFLPIDGTIPENILGIHELVVSHFSGVQLAHFLLASIGLLLSDCILEIRFVESLVACGETERAEFGQFMRQFHTKCKAISIFSYERQFQMPHFLLQPEIMAKVRQFQLNDSIPFEHLDLFIQWIHAPFQQNDGKAGREKTLQFRNGNHEQIDQFIGIIRTRFQSAAATASSSECAQFKILFVYTGQSPVDQFRWNFVETNQRTGENLTLRGLFYPKMFELRRKRGGHGDERKIDEIMEENTRREFGTTTHMVVNVFRPASSDK